MPCTASSRRKIRRSRDDPWYALLADISGTTRPEHYHTPGSKAGDRAVGYGGGQDEYRLIHQLFLHDTTLALVLLDPTRGRTAFEEAEGWSKRLEKQLAGMKST